MLKWRLQCANLTDPVLGKLTCRYVIIQIGEGWSYFQEVGFCRWIEILVWLRRQCFQESSPNNEANSH